VEAYTKRGQYKEAIQTCVRMNNWGLAVDLAHAHPDQTAMVEGFFTKLVDRTVFFCLMYLTRDYIANMYRVQTTTPDLFQTHSLRAQSLAVFADLVDNLSQPLQ